MEKFTYPEKCKIYNEALIAFGERNQLTVAIEELSECQKEICKILRGGEGYRNLAEEIADASIMMEQLQIMFSLEDCVENWKEIKIGRLEERLKQSVKSNQVFYDKHEVHENCIVQVLTNTKTGEMSIGWRHS